MYMAEGLDTGDIMLTEAFPIGAQDDFETVHDTSARISGELLLRAIDLLEEGNAPRIPQDDTQATYAEKITKEDCHIDFTKSATVVSARVRGVTPIPMAFSYHADKMLKLFRPTVTDGKGVPGEVIATDGRGEGSITVACGEGAVSFDRELIEEVLYVASSTEEEATLVQEYGELMTEREELIRAARAEVAAQKEQIDA
jgi:methionyl-tRNA formyltransferase